MATAVSIASNALLRLGADPINSFDEADTDGSNIERTRLAANMWPTVRRQVIRGHLWNNCTRRALLSPDAVPPAFGFTNRFLRPSDWLRTVAIGFNECDRYDFRYEAGYFLTNEPQFPLVYIFDNENAATYDASLVAAMEVAMMAAMAYPVTKSTSLASELTGVLDMHLRQARTLDAQDDPPQEFGQPMLYGSRFGGRIR